MIYSSPEPTKVCISCGGTFEYKFLVQGSNYEGGVRPLCKPCRRGIQTAERRRREQAVRDMAKAQAEVRKNTQDLVPPRTFNYLKAEPWDGKQEAIYIRNNGNKHIPSKGAVG
jgi:hypothetical protein